MKRLLALLLLMLASPLALAAPTIDAYSAVASNGGYTTISTTAVTVTTGDICLVVFNGPAGTNTITDTSGNIYTLLSQTYIQNPYTQETVYESASCTGGSVAVTLTPGGGGSASLWFIAIAGSGGVDQNTTNTGSWAISGGNGTWTSPSITTTLANELVLVFNGEQSNGTITSFSEANGFTLLAPQVSSSSAAPGVWGYKAATSTGAYQASFTAPTAATTVYYGNAIISFAASGTIVNHGSLSSSGHPLLSNGKPVYN